MARPGRRSASTISGSWARRRAALSPDGAQAVCTLQSFSMEENKGQTSLWLLSTFGGGPRRLTSCGEGRPAGTVANRRAHRLPRQARSSMARRTRRSSSTSSRRMAARRRVISDFAPASNPSSGCPTASASPSSPGCGPSCAAQGAGESASKEFTERKEAPTSPARRSTATGITRCRWAACRTCTCSTGRRQRPHRRPVRGHGLGALARRAGRHCFDVSPDGRRIVFAHDPGAEKRLDNCRALAEIELRTRRVATVAHARPGT